MIVKTFIGKYMDLSKVVSISDAYFIDHMGHGGYFAGFEIHIQLLEKPIEYMRSIDADHSGIRPCPIFNEAGKILGVAELQKEVDELVEQWRKVNESNNN